MFRSNIVPIVLKPHCYQCIFKKWSKSWSLKTIQSKMRKLDKLSELEDGEDKFVKHAKVKYSLKHHREITKYFNSKKCLKEIESKIPGHFMLRKLNSPRVLFIIDSEIAESLFFTLKPYFDNYSGHILEVNAGFGLFTDLLLKAQYPRLYIYESDILFQEILREKICKAKSDAKLVTMNLLQLWGLIIRDLEHNTNLVTDAFDNLPTKPWKDADPVLRMIVAIPSENFLVQVTYSTIFKSGLFNYGRPELFVIMTPLSYIKLTASPGDGTKMYRSRAVLFQIVFDHKILTKLPDKAFMPWLTDSRKMQKIMFQPKEEDKDVFYVVQVTARSDLFQRVNPDLVKPLWFFVRMLLQKRKARVIPIIERWIPGGGLRLIPLGYTIYTETGSLTPEKLVDLFLQFASWPEFHTCSFLSSMESMLVRMTEPTTGEQLQAQGERILDDESDSDSVDEEESEGEEGDSDNERGEGNKREEGR